jgi:hypothetical protein
MTTIQCKNYWTLVELELGLSSYSKADLAASGNCLPMHAHTLCIYVPIIPYWSMQVCRIRLECHISTWPLMVVFCVTVVKRARSRSNLPFIALVDSKIGNWQSVTRCTGNTMTKGRFVRYVCKFHVLTNPPYCEREFQT